MAAAFVIDGANFNHSTKAGRKRLNVTGKRLRANPVYIMRFCLMCKICNIIGTQLSECLEKCCLKVPEKSWKTP